MNVAPPAAPLYLSRLLEPFAPFLADERVTDIFINRPNEVWIEMLMGGVTRQDVTGLGAKELERLARQIAAFTHQGISRAHPLLAASMPDGARIQIVLPPATRGDISFSIRKHIAGDFGLADYEKAGAFSVASEVVDEGTSARFLLDLHNEGNFAKLLSAAVRHRRNILISGGTSSGKTTFLNALLREIPSDERLILIEDTPELQLRHHNAVGLLAARGDQGESRVSADDLLVASLRMRPDRIILGELRGTEAFTFMRAVSTGHPGSLTTIHADSPDRAVGQLAMLVLQRGIAISRADVDAYVRSVIDIYVQVERSAAGRRISEVRLADHLVAAASDVTTASDV